MNKIFAAAAIATAAVVGTLSLAPSSALAQQTNPDFVARVVELTNQQRRANGLSDLRVSAALTQAAQGHANDQAVRNYVAHNTPEGVTPRDRIMRMGYDTAASTAENLYYYYGNQVGIQPEAAVQWWMNSPGHRANILDARLNEIGVGLAIAASDGKYIYVQNFGSAASGTGGWGSLAYSPSTGLFGVVASKASGAIARSEALQMCARGAQDCVHAVTYRHGCGVVKRDPATGRWGAGEAGGNGMPAINVAGADARNACVRAGGQGCNDLVAAYCSR